MPFGFPLRKKKSSQNPVEMRTATANDVVVAVDDLRPALENVAKSCNNNHVVPTLATETFKLLLQPVKDLPPKLGRASSLGESTLNSVECGELITSVRECKETTNHFAKGIEDNDETIMLVNINKMLRCVRFIVEHTSLGYDKSLIASLDAKARDLEQAIEKSNEKRNATLNINNHSNGQLNANTGVGDQEINSGPGQFFKAPLYGSVSFGPAQAQAPPAVEQPASKA